jgi:hypothetical protein
MKNKALFPISVDSKHFGTEETINALNNISIPYSEIVFLVADGLQLYNKAAQSSTNDSSLNTIISNFKLNNNYYVERERWLQSVKSKTNNLVSNAYWNITNIFLISDNVFHDIYRNIFVSYLSLGNFRNDVIHAAKKHRKRISKQFSEYDLELSIAYIIEEIAVNLRLRVVEKIEAEYYIGSLLEPLVNLYFGKYDIDVFTLAGVSKYEMEFKFYYVEEYDSKNLIWRSVKEMCEECK